MRKTYSEIASDITNIKALITADGKIDAAELQSVLNNINDSYGKDVYNVKNYGAVGDGTTDDTAAIQSAIAALTSNGRGKLYFPYGEYKVTSTLNFSVSCTIEGDGSGDNWFNPYDIPADYVPTFVSRISYYNHTTPCISFPHTGLGGFDGHFDNIIFGLYKMAIVCTHPTTPTSGSAGVNLNTGRNFKIRDCLFRNFYDNVRVNKNCGEYVIDSNVFLNPVNAQIIANNTEFTDFGDQCITNNAFRPDTRNSNYGIVLTCGGGIKICNNKFNGTGYGIYWYRVNIPIYISLAFQTVDTLICNNSIENFAQEAVYVNGNAFGMFSHTFHGNQIGYGQAAYHTLRYLNCYDIAITGNVLIGAPTTPECIDLTGSSRAVIYGNMIRGYSGPSNNGIYKGGTSVQVLPTTQTT